MMGAVPAVALEEAIDDVLGVIVFALVMSLAGAGNMVFTIGKMVLFFPIAWFIGDKIVPIVVRWEQKLHNREASLALLLGLVLILYPRFNCTRRELARLAKLPEERVEAECLAVLREAAVRTRSGTAA